jgi:predicted kinase
MSAGYSVIVDAAFLWQEERESFRVLAQSLSAPFGIASLYAGNETSRERILQRRNDASEADADVLERLKAVQQALSVRELEYTARFTTEEAPDSSVNSRGWDRLVKLLA